MVRHLIRSAFRRVGYDITPYSPGTSHEAQFGAMLGQHGIDLVLDIGANTGQFAAVLRRRVGYRGRIVSFEPMAAAHAELLRASAGDESWEISPRVALGGTAGEVSLNISGNSVSSSICAMLDAHVNAAPESRYVDSETVPLVTLDSVASMYVRDARRVFLKIDTQGYEAEVLRGAAQLLERSVGVQLELSVVPLYEGQKLILDLWQQMNDAGFEFWSMAPAFIDPASGRMLQVDATFFRKAGE